MLGGKNEPCVNRDTLLQIQAAHEDQDCPRVQLLPKNEDGTAELALLGARAGLDHPMWGRLLDLHTEELPKEERLDRLYRAVNALSHPDVGGRIKATRDRAVRGATR